MTRTTSMLLALLCLSAVPASADETAPAEPSPSSDQVSLVEALVGVHLCGDHWNEYKNYCEVVLEDGRLKVRTLGERSLIEGEIRIVDDKRFTVVGRVRQIAKPWQDFDAECGGTKKAGEYSFRQTGKRKYWRHVRTCPSMLTFYFDLFHKLTPKEKALADLAKWSPAPESPATTPKPLGSITKP